MSTLLKRIIFIIIVLFVIYGIYRLIDRQGADDLKEGFINNTQETIEDIKGDIPSKYLGSGDSLEESFGDISEVISTQNIIIEDTIVEEPEIKKQETPIIENKPVIKSTPTKNINILFQLFK